MSGCYYIIQRVLCLKKQWSRLDLVQRLTTVMSPLPLVLYVHFSTITSPCILRPTKEVTGTASGVCSLAIQLEYRELVYLLGGQ